MIYQSDLLLTQIKQKAAITTGMLGFTDADILNIATRRLQIDIASQIIQKKEEYLLQEAIVPLTASEDYYRIPYRAIGSSIRHIYFVANNSTQRYSLNRLYHEDLEAFNQTNSNAIPSGFILEGSWIRLVPSVSASPSGSLYIEYFFRPNQIVPNIYARQITNVSGQTVTFASMPSQLSSQTKFDIINHISGNEIIQFDVAGTVAGNQITFTDTLLPDVVIGNWVSATQTSPVPMIPEEFQELLIAITVLDIQNLRGNQAGIQVAMGDVQALMKAVETLTIQRVQSKPELVIPRNPIARRIGHR